MTASKTTKAADDTTTTTAPDPAQQAAVVTEIMKNMTPELFQQLTAAATQAQAAVATQAPAAQVAPNAVPQVPHVTAAQVLTSLQANGFNADVIKVLPTAEQTSLMNGILRTLNEGGVAARGTMGDGTNGKKIALDGTNVEERSWYEEDWVKYTAVAAGGILVGVAGTLAYQSFVGDDDNDQLGYAGQNGGQGLVQGDLPDISAANNQPQMVH